MATGDDGFLSRWARRKAQVQTAREALAPPPPGAPWGEAPPAAAADASHAPAAAAHAIEAPAAAPALPQAIEPPAGAPSDEPAPPAPTLADVALLGRDSDYTRFVAPGVDESVKRAAMKKMFFSDPHFNVMDGLDTYIEDFNAPDPLPASMLRKMWQAKSLGLFDDEEEDAAQKHMQPDTPPTVAQASPDGAARAAVSQSATESAVPLDEDADLRLQPDDDPGRPGPGEGAGRGVG